MARLRKNQDDLEGALAVLHQGLIALPGDPQLQRALASLLRQTGGAGPAEDKIQALSRGVRLF